MSIVTAIISNALFVVLLPVHLVRQAVYCSRAIVRFAISTIEFAISMLHYYTQEQKVWQCDPCMRVCVYVWTVLALVH